MSLVVPPPLGEKPAVPPPRSNLRRPSLAEVAAVVLILLIGLYQWSVPLGPAPLWSHLKYGQWILENDRLPEREPFCRFADPKARLVDYQWLSQVALESWQRRSAGLGYNDSPAGGVADLQLGHALLTVATSILLVVAFRRASGSWSWACLGLGLWLVLRSSIESELGPGSFGALCLAGLLWALSRSPPSWLAVVVIPFWLALWANLDGSFWVGLILLACFLLGRAVDASRSDTRWRPWRAVLDSGCWRYLLAGGLSILAIAWLNPYGFRLYSYTFLLLGKASLMAAPEWRPLDFTLPEVWPWFCLASLGLLAAAQFFSPCCFRPAQVLALLVFGTATCLQQRNMAWWAQVAPWLLLSLPPAQATATEPEERRAPKWNSFSPALAFALAALAVGSWVSVRHSLAQRSGVNGATPTRGLPWGISRDLERGKTEVYAELKEAVGHGYEGRFQGSIFTSPRQGDYLLWALPADMPVTLYSQLERFARDHWDDYQTAALGQTGWWEILDRWRVNLIVVEVEGHEPLCAKIRRDPDWLVIADPPENLTAPARTRLFIALRKAPLPS